VAALSAEDHEQAMHAVLHTLTASALSTNLARCLVLDSALTALEQGRCTDTVRLEAEQAAHQMVGSAGTFGFPHVSDLAGELEQLLAGSGAEDADSADGTPADPGEATDLARARQLLAQIQAELTAGSAGGHQPAG